MDPISTQSMSLKTFLKLKDGLSLHHKHQQIQLIYVMLVSLYFHNLQFEEY